MDSHFQAMLEAFEDSPETVKMLQKLEKDATERKIREIKHKLDLALNQDEPVAEKLSGEV